MAPKWPVMLLTLLYEVSSIKMEEDFFSTARTTQSFPRMPISSNIREKDVKFNKIMKLDLKWVYMAYGSKHARIKTGCSHVAQDHF